MHYLLFVQNRTWLSGRSLTTSFWQYDLSLIFTKVFKIYAIIIFVNIPDLELLLCIRES